MTDKTARKPLAPGADGIVRLSGGNPQVPKGDGDGPVQTYIAAMPGWQSAVGRRLDALIEEVVPDVHKAIRWNTAFYGTEAGTFFAGFHCLTRYVKVAFPMGARLDPVPPGTSKQANVRYLDIGEAPGLDEDRFRDWIRQASRLPGEKFGG